MREGKINLSSLTKSACLAALALIIFSVEACVPVLVAIPGIKLGLANVVTLASVYLLGKRQALFILVVRILLGNIITGQMMAMIYSFSGGMLCFIVTIALKPYFKGNTIWALGTIGAVFHNIGQLICAYFMLGSGSLLYYGFVLTVAAIITGSFTGLCAQYVILHKGINKK